MSQISFNSVSKIYEGNIEAVRNISFIINSGELLVLCGPSGCGKSTVLRMLAGLEDISSGEVRIDDRIINHIPPKDRDIAMVFQNYALYPHMSVFDNIAFSLKLRKIPKNEIKQRVEKTAATLGLSELLKRKPKTLSGGQRQRIAMGRAIVRDPLVYLFDEPLSNLDAKMRTELRKEILQMHQNIPITKVYVTHDQIEAMTLGDRICVMNKGKIEQIGTPAEIFNQPSSLFVAQFIGTPPMNIIKGTLQNEDDQLYFKSPAFSALIPEDKLSLLSSFAGKEVSLGIRPSHLKVCEAHASQVIAGTVEVTEMLGEETLLHVTSDKMTCIARIPHLNNSYPINSQVYLTPDLTQAHIFDGETGKNLTLTS